MYKLLLVDDEYMILECLKYLLPWQELGFEIVKTCRSAKEALAYLNEHPIDLLITDITMPEMSGIEMVSQAQSKGNFFATIILSGYQEFTYVKQGMQLGVKNYLVKPVDKEELLTTVQKVKLELDNQVTLALQQQAYVENHLIRWLNDDLNEREFQEMLTSYGVVDQGPYTVIQIVAPPTLLKQIEANLSQQRQKLVLGNWTTNQEKLIWVHQGSKIERDLSLVQMEHQLSLQGEILVGETVAEWENVYESYEKIRQLSAMKKFYPDLLPSSQSQLLQKKPKNELSFLAFNQSLMIGDLKTIHAELDKIFATIVAQHYDPEEARYLAFFLFSDIARQYPNIAGEIYDEAMQKVRHSHTIMELHALLEEILKKVQTTNREKPFSQMVQKIVDIVQEESQQDLNLSVLAEELHINVVYLGQLFKKETQSSFSQYLNQIRIRKAQQLLLHTEKNIAEIAEEIGYNNTNYFSKMFKKLNGLTPKEFREKYAGDYADLFE